MKKILFSILLSFTIFFLYGQEQNEWLLRKKNIIVEQGQIQIDTFSIQPGFFLIQTSTKKIIPKTEYQVDYPRAVLQFNDSTRYLHQLLSIYYLTYPSSLKKKIFSYTRSPQNSNDSLLLPVIDGEKQYQPQLLEGLKTEGSITRGFSAGNNQSLVMKSGMELKIEGNLSPTVKLKAVIADDNMPQAYAGISKSYKEFNYLYMELTGPGWKTRGGDFTEQKQPSYFLKYQRKLQGIKFETGKKTRISVTGGIVDGQFNRQQFNGMDGNQGPYLLKGKNGEKYIFITKGSEKVFINGKLLQNNRDYNIDYELAQITFSPTIPISSNDRISVEFNYSNQYYLRYLNQNRLDIVQKKGNLSVYTYFEKDDRFRTLIFDLDSVAVQKLREAGDNPGELLIESAKQTSYSENKILYKKTVDGNQTYFEYTNKMLPELYEVRFSYTGQNQGSYIIDKITAIGNIYRYVGKENGDYEPVIKLIAPISRNYAGFKWSNELSPALSFQSDILLSQADNNLFSSIDDEDNTGLAMNLNLSYNLKKDSLKNWNIYGKYRFTHQNFIPLDPYIDPEFLYRWQIENLLGKQHYLEAGNIYSSDSLHIDTGMEYLSLRDTLDAYKLRFSGEKKGKKARWTGRNFIVKQNLPSGTLSNFNFDNSLSFDREQSAWSHRIHWEKRDKTRKKQPDSLNFGFRFYESKWIHKAQTENEWQIGVRIEENDSISQQKYGLARSKKMVFLDKKLKYKTGKMHFYSRWEYIHSITSGNQSFYNFSVNWKQNWIKKWMETSLKVETYNGNIIRDAVLFVETPPGQGVYQWVDYNQNGIKEINEFEIAVFSDEARYIKVVLPSKNLLAVRNNLYSFQWIFHPLNNTKKKILKKLYNRLFIETSHQVPLKQNASLLVWNPNDALLKNTRLQNDFYINRSKKKYKFHLRLQKMENQQWLLIGKQGIKAKSILFETTHHFWSQLIWHQSFEVSEREQFSENYPKKNFDILEWKWEQNLSLYKTKKNQVKFFYYYKNKESLKGVEHLSAHALGMNYIYFANKKHILYTQIKYVNNDFSGNPYSPVAFYMFEGLQKGKNILSEFNYRKKINASLEAQISYQFRISTGHSGIHTAGISMRMHF